MGIKIKSNKIILRVLSIVLLIFLLSTNNIIKSNASTVNDIRELLGRQRLSEEMLQSEVEELAEQYLSAELNNVAAEMLRLGEAIVKNPDIEVKQLDLYRRIEIANNELYDCFVTNAPVNKVLAAKTKTRSLDTEISKYITDGYQLDLEFIPNRWSDLYKEVQETASKYDDSFDIGDAGGEMESAVKGRFELASPFGSRWDPIEIGKIGIHKGIDLRAKEGNPILAQWNGVVVNVYETNGYGKAIDIQHGTGLLTRYAHLSKQEVKIGDEVSQYQQIGLAGSTGRSTGPHLHLEVYLDDVLVNPLLLYGNKGMDAYYNWAKENPGAIIEDDDIQKIKDSASGGNNTEGKKYEYGFYNTITKEYSNDDIEVLPGEIIPSLPEGYKRPEPGVLE